MLVVECFAGIGIGGLKQALDLLGLVPMGHVGIDNSAECGKVFRQHCRHALWYKNIEDITFEEVKEWRKRFAKATKVILSGGWPCINHSQLNPRRGGAEATSSQLRDKMLEVRTMLKAASKHVGLPNRHQNRCRNALYAVGEMSRHSIDPTSWTWKVLMAYAWKRKDQHINVLEMVSVLDLLRKLVRNVKCHNSPMVILVDNQVALSVLTKGRTSAKALQSPIRRVSAVLLASEVLACYGWIKSSWNPADGPSRWVQRRTHA